MNFAIKNSDRIVTFFLLVVDRFHLQGVKNWCEKLTDIYPDHFPLKIFFLDLLYVQFVGTDSYKSLKRNDIQ